MKNERYINNGLINFHFGVHKTATTYIQENLELITDTNFHYNKLSDYRMKLKDFGYSKYLRSLNWNKKIVISDENMIGGAWSILNGDVYPKFNVKVTTFLRPFRNRRLVNVYISIRPMTSYLSSQYCEYLRWKEYIPYNDFTSKTHLNDLSWFDVFHEAINSNNDFNFYIYDFCKFDEYKDGLLNKLSFGLMKSCDQNVKRSRASFTYQEIAQLSNGAFHSDNEATFAPHTEEEEKISTENYQNDLVRLGKIPNVKVLPSL